ncbi:hypothetical protein M3P05_05130 [Sansalvadorimonas sp. 2012CJ34-2]|uniref:Uncharacterized protein n=1 Tax=Parendozoicomonas callyspongiae TaxID=2942213 RepID=A0ABT0PD65_9GAMM|nr:hypothetical protein [Sansalvadorimonas sp. 2012CJ34-2]MCL6269327.1 hypothetical protein [Sansalvadorimonas sp. 2012CJ34-2]
MSNPTVRQCRYCQQPLAAHIPANREYCGDIACRAAWQKDLVAIQDQKRLDEENAFRTDVRKITLQQASEGGFDPDELTLTVVPCNPHEVAQTSRAARKGMETFLRHLLDTLDLYDTEEVFTAEVEAPPSPHLDALINVCCSACRGNCCLQGKDTHAYLQRVTLKRVMDEFGLNKEQLLKRYLDQIPDKSMERGCLYQADNGCNLDEQLRADICKDYFCESMITMMNHHNRVMPGRNLVVSEDSNKVMAVKILDTNGERNINSGADLKF